MTKYRGYYIDHVIFNSKAEIDEYLKQSAINTYKAACKWFAEQPCLEAAQYAADRAEALHTAHGLTWSEIEEIEIEAYKQAC